MKKSKNKNNGLDLFGPKFKSDWNPLSSSKLIRGVVVCCELSQYMQKSIEALQQKTDTEEKVILVDH